MSLLITIFKNKYLTVYREVYILGVAQLLSMVAERVQFKLSPELKADLKEICAELGVKMTHMIREAVINEIHKKRKLLAETQKAQEELRRSRLSK